MAELLKNGDVFIHVPKSGGNWVRDLLRRQNLWRCRIGYKHSTPERINDVWRFHRWQFLKHLPTRPDVTPAKLRRAYKFCFVRNPVAWYESWWKFMAGDWHPWEVGRWHPQRPIDGCGSDDFNTFVENVLRDHPSYVSEMYAEYARGCDFVGRTETMADDLESVLGERGISFEPARFSTVARVNVSPKRLGLPQWKPEVFRRLVDSERSAIVTFGYEDEIQELCLRLGA